MLSKRMDIARKYFFQDQTFLCIFGEQKKNGNHSSRSVVANPNATHTTASLKALEFTISVLNFIISAMFA